MRSVSSRWYWTFLLVVLWLPGLVFAPPTHADGGAPNLAYVSGTPSGISVIDVGHLSRRVLRYILAGFWCFAALLQLQPNWWQQGQISQAIGAMVGAGGLNSVLVDPALTPISNATA